MMGSEQTHSSGVVSESEPDAQASQDSDNGWKKPAGSDGDATENDAPPAQQQVPAQPSQVGRDPGTNGDPTAAQTGREAGKGSEVDMEPPLRRFRLKPKVDPAHVKPVPNIPPAAKTAPATTPSAPAEPPANVADEQADTPDAAEMAGSSEAPAAPPGPEPQPAESTPAEAAATQAPDTPAPETFRPPPAVDLPPTAALDADLEAEIAAALAADEADAGTAVEARLPVDAAAQEKPAAAERTAEQPTEESLQSGQHLKGTVQSIHGEDVFLDLGFRAPGIVPLRQFSSGKSAQVGQEVEVLVDRFDEEEGLIYVNLPRGSRRTRGDWNSVSVGQIVECVVDKVNKGGLELQIGGLRAFMPAGQVDVNFVADLEPYVGRKLQAQVVEVNPRRRNLVVSRRALVEAERKEAEEMLWVKLDVGQTYDGRVTTLKDYGAFVDIGGVDGFLHVGEISWNRIKHPSDVLQPGQDVKVKVISLDREKKRIGLGMRQLTSNPWLDAAAKFGTGTTVTGKVTRTTKFGAFVELEPGVEGLVHISELDHRRVKSVSEVLTTGQEADFQVLEVDPDRQRISLSLKALLKKPEPSPDDAKAQQGRPAEASPPRRTRSNLKGGMGDTPAGKLFGDPRDFR